jgi:hypothetical protein
MWLQRTAHRLSLPSNEASQHPPIREGDNVVSPSNVDGCYHSLRGFHLVNLNLYAGISFICDQGLQDVGLERQVFFMKPCDATVILYTEKKPAPLGVRQAGYSFYQIIIRNRGITFKLNR